MQFPLIDKYPGAGGVPPNLDEATAADAPEGARRGSSFVVLFLMYVS